MDFVRRVISGHLSAPFLRVWHGLTAHSLILLNIHQSHHSLPCFSPFLPKIITFTLVDILLLIGILTFRWIDICDITVSLSDQQTHANDAIERNLYPVVS